MNILSIKRIKEYASEHADSGDSLLRWYYLTKEGKWKNLKDIKEVFNTVDYVGNDLYVFNIRGNKYRLIARIFFGASIVYIKFIGTHAEYDKLDLDDL